jgi:hypothetical protein
VPRTSGYSGNDRNSAISNARNPPTIPNTARPSTSSPLGDGEIEHRWREEVVGGDDAENHCEETWAETKEDGTNEDGRQQWQIVSDPRIVIEQKAPAHARCDHQKRCAQFQPARPSASEGSQRAKQLGHGFRKEGYRARDGREDQQEQYRPRRVACEFEKQSDNDSC